MECKFFPAGPELGQNLPNDVFALNILNLIVFFIPVICVRANQCICLIGPTDEQEEDRAVREASIEKQYLWT